MPDIPDALRYNAFEGTFAEPLLDPANFLGAYVPDSVLAQLQGQAIEEKDVSLVEMLRRARRGKERPQAAAQQSMESQLIRRTRPYDGLLGPVRQVGRGLDQLNDALQTRPQ